MGLLGRGVRRATRHLGDDEDIVASLVGTEADGRRRRFVLVTRRRVLVGSARGDEPLDLGLDGVCARFDRVSGLLTLQRGDVEIVLRDVDELPARALVEVITHRRRPPSPASAGTRTAVRVLHDTAERTHTAS